MHVATRIVGTGGRRFIMRRRYPLPTAIERPFASIYNRKESNSNNVIELGKIGCRNRFLDSNELRSKVTLLQSLVNPLLPTHRTLWKNCPHRDFSTKAVTESQTEDPSNDSLVYDGSKYGSFSKLLFSFQSIGLLGTPLALHYAGEQTLTGGSILMDYALLCGPAFVVCAYIYDKLRRNVVQKLFVNHGNALLGVETFGRSQRVNIGVKEISPAELYTTKRGALWSLSFQANGITYYIHARSKEKEQIAAIFTHFDLEYVTR